MNTKDFPTIISFYTRDTLYENEVQALIDSCKKFALHYEIDGIPSLGNWLHNCYFKPRYILEKLQQLKTNLLWVDADAMFINPPGKFNIDADFAPRMDLSLPTDHPDRVISNSIYVKYNPLAIQILKEWEEECFFELSKENRKKEILDQGCLREVLNKNTKAKVEGLDLKYCRIADEESDEPLEESIIVHFQASRLLKKILNEELCSFSDIDSLSSYELKKLRGFDCTSFS